MKGAGWVILTAAAAAGGALAHTSHRAVDGLRLGHELETDYHFMPSPEATRVASMGFEQQVGDVLWVRTILTYGERWDAPDPAWNEWIYRMLQAVITLDPAWRTPYFYGGILLRTTGAIETSNAIFEAGHEVFPDDYYFPFSVGMNYYLSGGDPVLAARWLKVAADCTGAPEWYIRAANAFVVKEGEREVARHYLLEELESATDPKLRKHLEGQLAQLQHDDYADGFSQLAREYERETGQAPSSPEALVGVVLEALPPDPLGGRWIMDVDGTIISSVEAARRAAEAQRIERRVLRFIPSQ